MFVVTEADAAAIRAVYQQRGEFAAALELRRRFPGHHRQRAGTRVRPHHRRLEAAATADLAEADLVREAGRAGSVCTSLVRLGCFHPEAPAAGAAISKAPSMAAFKASAAGMFIRRWATMTLSDTDSLWISGGRHVWSSLERDTDDPVDMPERRGVIDIEEWGMSASNSRYLTCHTGDDFDWRFHVGLVGHDNIPRFWNPEEQCWRPIVASSGAAWVADRPEYPFGPAGVKQPAGTSTKGDHHVATACADDR